MASSSVEVSKNDKQPKEEYQKFKENKEKDNTVEKIGQPLPSETTEKSSGFIDLKDFPQLRGSGKQNENLFFKTKVNSSQFKSGQPWLNIVKTRGGKKLRESFPALGNSENVRKNEIRKENTTMQATHINDISESTNAAGAEKQSNTNKEKTTVRTGVQPQKNPNKKKRSDPVFINFLDILATNKIQRRTRKNQPRLLRNKFQRHRKNELLSGNFLDASNPKRNKGKHREIKKKKLSNFKRTIIKERIIKSKVREMAVVTMYGPNSDNFLDDIDFRTEIKIYLTELNNKKLKNLEIRKSRINENVTIDKQTGGIQESLGKQVIKKENLDIEEAKISENTIADQFNGGTQESLGTVVIKKENLEIVPSVKEKIIPHSAVEGQIKFSSKFREYCDNIINPDLNSAITRLIEELIKLQDRLFLRDPIKAKARKRHVSGIREVRKYLSLKKVKMIIIAPNLEKLQMEGSVYDSINELKFMSDSQNVPYGFALDRYKLGRCTRKNVPVSAFAVLSYEGLEALYENALHELQEAKRKFSELLVKPKTEDDKEDVNSRVLSTLVSSFEELLIVPKEEPLSEGD